jgi:L-seryl-tRNA(Ser) seleniumtransferase
MTRPEYSTTDYAGNDAGHPSAVDGVQAQQAAFRRLPALDALLRVPAIALLVGEYGQAMVTDMLRDLLARARKAIGEGGTAPGIDEWSLLLADALATAAQPLLRPVVNATGVIVHTNLGRAPLSNRARQAIAAISHGYSNLEYQLAAGSRGSRHDHAQALLCQLTGAEDALVVNNNAAAIYLALAGLCAGRQVLISRGQLVEIGGGFRIPDVLRQSGAQLIEVGTTNRTHLRDFSTALGSETAAIMRVHSSNFKQIGFVTEPTLAELATVAKSGSPEPPVILIDDLGSGTLLDTTAYGLAPEPMIQASVAAGADVVTFSGDKLLGGPQAGIIVGRADLVERLRRHPLARALRVDKLTLAALEATLHAYQRGQAVQEIPVWQMIAMLGEQIAARAHQWQQVLAGAGIPGTVIAGVSAVGGGSLPGETLPTYLLAIDASDVDAMAARLRMRPLPVICRIQQDQLLFDPRTVLPNEDDMVVEAIQAAWQGA